MFCKYIRLISIQQRHKIPDVRKVTKSVGALFQIRDRGINGLALYVHPQDHNQEEGQLPHHGDYALYLSLCGNDPF